MANDPDFRLTLRPLKSGVPVDHRLAKLLKAALRAHGFRCVKQEAVDAAGNVLAWPKPLDQNSCAGCFLALDVRSPGYSLVEHRGRRVYMCTLCIGQAPGARVVERARAG